MHKGRSPGKGSCQPVNSIEKGALIFRWEPVHKSPTEMPFCDQDRQIPYPEVSLKTSSHNEQEIRHKNLGIGLT
jgi:hypothetical protein